MRDYSNIDKYYQELMDNDPYHQPIDDGHLKLMENFIGEYVLPLRPKSVLDVGSGEGYTKRILDAHKVSCEEIDIENGQDFNFLGDVNFDLILSRHTLEHSPFPLITLMEWHKVSNKYLALVLPNPEHFKYVGRNHYSVMNQHQAVWLLRRAGWKVRKFSQRADELWFLCDKMKRISYEGWAEIPLRSEIHAYERDRLKEKSVDDLYKDYK